MNIQGGPGVLIATPNVGNLATNPSPYKFPVLQEWSVDFKGDLKKLYGAQQFSLDILRGKIDVTGKGKMIVPQPDFLGQTFFGLSPSSGINRPVDGEQHAIAASVSTTQVTANTDLGVINASTGEQMTKILTGTPTAGQYKFTPYNSTGPVDASYAFAAADVTAAFPVILSYSWPDTAGLTLQITNQPIGSAPQMAMALFNLYKGKNYALYLNAVVLGMFSIPSKQEDHWISDFDFAAQTDVSNVLGYIEADI